MRILNELSNLFILMERDNFIRLATPIILYLPGKLYIIAGKKGLGWESIGDFSLVPLLGGGILETLTFKGLNLE